MTILSTKNHAVTLTDERRMIYEHALGKAEISP